MQAKHPTDHELLHAWRAGDLAAGNRLFERHHRGLLRFFANKAGPDCEDLVQSTFLGCIEGIERFRGDSSFRTLLFAIAWNKLRVHNIHRERAPAPLEGAVYRTAPTFGTLMNGEQERDILRVAMLRLPLDVQTMLELHYWEGMQVKEIAQVLERTVGAIKTRMRRGREQLASECEALRMTHARAPTLPHGDRCS